MKFVRHTKCAGNLAARKLALAVATVCAGVGATGPAFGVAWNATDPGSSAISTNGLTDNYGLFTNESVITNTGQGEYGTCTYLGNGWVLTALHVVSGSTYGVTVAPSTMQVNIYGQNYYGSNYVTFGSSDIALMQLAGYTSGNATLLSGVQRSQIYTGSSETGNLEQLGGFGNNDQLNSGVATNNETFHRGFNIAYADGGFIDVSANGNARLVQDGYLLGYQQAGDSGSGLWMDNGPDQDLNLHDWSLIGALDTGTTPGYFGDGGQYARVSSYSGTIINTVFAHSWLTWTANASSTTAVDGPGTWNLTTTNFTDGTNYAFNSPMQTQIATFGAGNGVAGTITLGANIPIDRLTFNAAGSGNYTIAGGGYSLLLTSESTITTNVNATISAPMTGGSSTQHGAVNEVIKNGTGTLTLTGPTTLNSGVTLRLSTGGVTIGTGGSVALTNAFAGVGWYTGDIATLTVMGTGVFSDTGSPGDLNLADVGGTGVLNVQDSATVTANNLYIGKGSTGLTGSGGTGTVNQTGGTISAGYVSLGTFHPLSSGTYNLNGGNLSTASIVGGLGSSTFNFNGGQLIASAASTTLMQNLNSASINAAATINTNGYNVTLNQPLSHSSAAANIDGGLIKSGAGTLTLGGGSTYTGPTVINTGTISLSPAAGAAAVAITPVGSYSFDNVSGTTVVNGGSGGTGMNGTLTGNAAIVPGGRFGNAVSLSGGGSVVVNSPITDTGGAADWTISAWVKTTTPGGAILDKSDGSTWTYDNSVFYLGSGNAGGTGGVPSSVRYGRGFFQAGSNTPSVDDGTWHMVTYVDAAGNYSIYTDGVQVVLSSGNSGFEQAVEQGGVVTFGITTDGISGDGTTNFNGLLDEIQVYNRPLTAAQVQRLYTTDSPNPTPVTSVLPATTAVSLSNIGLLDLAGNSQTIASLNGPAGAAVKFGTGTLTVGSTGGSITTFSGHLGGTNGSLIKSGNGTLVLAGGNTYTGTTTITGGTIRLVTPAAVTAATPIASYTFSQVSGTTVVNSGSGGTGLNGTLNENGGTGYIATTGGPAAGLGALVLNGDGTTVDINSGITSLSNTATWTMTAWIKTTQAGATILDKGNGSGWNAGYSTFYLGTGNNSGSGSLPDAVRYAGGWLAGSTSVTDGTWHMITYTDSAGAQSIYVDGVADTITQNQFTNSDTGSVVRLGFAPTNVDGELPTKGSLSDIGVYGTALTAAQVASQYTAVAGNLPLPTATSLTITTGGTLDVNGTTQTVGGLTGTYGSAVKLGTGQLIVSSSLTTTFAGNITGTGGSLTKAGTGTLILSGANNYTGSTLVSAGTLRLANAAPITAAVPIASYNFNQVSGSTVVNAGSGGASLNGTLNVNGGTGYIATTGGPAAGMGALVLNGDGTTVDINSGITSLSNTATWTVSAWIKTTQAGATILDKGNGTGWANGYSTFYLGTGFNAGSGGVPDAVRYGGGWLAGSTPVNDGTWHLVTYTDSGGTENIYVDGIAETLTQNQFLNIDTGSVVRIGFAPTNSDGEVATRGSLSGINFYNSALSANQVYGIYSAVTGATVGAPLSTASPVSVAAGATLDLNGTAQTAASLNGPAGSFVTLGSGTLTFKTAGTSTFLGVISGSGSVAMSGTGTQTLGGNDTYIGTTTVTGGTLSLGANTLASGILVRTSAGLNVSGGKLVVPSATSHINRDLLVIGTGGLQIAGTGVIDLGSNDLQIQSGGGSGLATITSQLQQGYAFGSWNGNTGITSTAAAADGSHLTAIGAILNNNLYGTTTGTRFDTVNPGASDVLVKYTYYGDANLDGIVNGSDYSLIDYGYAQNLTGWYNGDFNYDGIIDGSDYSLIDNAFNNQGTSLTSTAQLEAVATAQVSPAAAVPEPASMAMIAIAATALLGRFNPRCNRSLIF